MRPPSRYTLTVRRSSSTIPLLATLLATGYLLAAVALPGLVPVVGGAAAVAACALTLTRRSAPGLSAVLVGLGVWLGMAFLGAWWLREQPQGGLLWLLLMVFALPMPVIPWLYARTFGPGAGQAESDAP